MSKLLSAKGLADRFDVDVGTIHRWVREGILPPASNAPKRRDRLWSAGAVEAWLGRASEVGVRK